MHRRSAVRPGRVTALFDDVELWLTVNGSSMLPALCSGTRVRLASRRHGRASPGDIVVYRDRSGLVCHRVLWTRRRRVLVAGDAAAARVDWIGSHRLLGRVVAVQPPAGQIRNLDGAWSRAAGRARAARTLVRLAAAALRDGFMVCRRALAFTAAP